MAGGPEGPAIVAAERVAGRMVKEGRTEAKLVITVGPEGMVVCSYTIY